MRQFRLEWISFWIGFFSGIITWLIITGLRIIFPRLSQTFKNWRQSSQKGMEVNVEDRIRNDILRRVQRLNIASPLFSLDEILVVPELIAPPPSLQFVDKKGDVDAFENRTQYPYMPDCPELAVANHINLLSLPQALKGGSNILLIGKPGSGKTVALSYLASRIIERDQEFQELLKYLPIYLHVNDIIFPTKTPYEPLNIIIDALSEYIPSIGSPRFISTMHNELQRKNILLLLDGLDELPPERIDMFVEYIKNLLQKYPGNRMVIAASYEYWDGFMGLGFTPIALAAWNDLQKISFLEKWSGLWKRYVAVDVQTGPQDVDPLLLNQWILGSEMNTLPLDFTLKTWAAYAGDILGPNPPEVIESYILRMMGDLTKGRGSLSKMAAQMVANQSLAITSRDASRWVQELQQMLSKEATSTPTDASTESSPKGSPQIEPSAEPSQPLPDVGKPDAQAALETGLSIGRVMPELVENGVSGLVVNDTAGELADAVLDLLHHPEKREALGKAAYEKAHRDFRLDRQVEAVESFYQEMIRLGKWKRSI